MPTIEDLPMCVLVEDSDEDADTFNDALRQSGIKAELRRVCSGDACMALLRQAGPRLPALIVMDLNTLGMDGREALRLIKSDLTLMAIPLVIFSTSANPRDLEFCYGAGANAYQVKPMRYLDHVRAMSDLLDYWLTRVALPAHDRLPS
jgi:CheY-like chemotaxis protein